MKFIATTSEKISSIPIISGQLIFSRDDRIIYLDSDVRTSFQQIITVDKDKTRLELVNPIQGFYFINETKVLWNYNGIEWNKITSEQKEQIVFAEKTNFPVAGEENILYVDKENIYQWDSSLNDYIEMNNPKWKIIS